MTAGDQQDRNLAPRQSLLSQPADLKRGLTRGLDTAVAAIRALSRPVETRTAKEQVATISAHNDPGVGKLVADAFERVGKEGVEPGREGIGRAPVREPVGRRDPAAESRGQAAGVAAGTAGK